MAYLNPFELLENYANGAELSGADVSTLRRARRRLLAEADLEGTIRCGKHTLTKNEAAAVLDELDDDDRFENHVRIYDTKLLLDFLNDGNPWIFNDDEEYEIQDFCTNFTHIARPFAEQFSREFLSAYEEYNESLLKDMSRFLASVDDEYHDACYQDLERLLKKQIDDYKQLLADVKNEDAEFDEDDFAALTDEVDYAIDADTLNALPDYFEVNRDRLANLLDQIAVNLHNNFGATATALHFSRLAVQIEVTALNRSLIEENHEILEKTAREATAQQEFERQLQKIERVAAITDQLKKFKAEFVARYVAGARDNLLGNRIYVRGLKDQIQEILDFSAINNLSDELDFVENLRDSIAAELKGLSLVSYNYADDLDFALWLVETALQIKVSPETDGKLLKSKNQLLEKINRRQPLKNASVSEKFYTREKTPAQPSGNASQSGQRQPPPNYQSNAHRRQSSGARRDFQPAAPFNQTANDDYARFQKRLYGGIGAVVLIVAACVAYVGLQSGSPLSNLNAGLKEMNSGAGFSLPTRNADALNRTKFKGKILPVDAQVKTVDADFYRQLSPALKPSDFGDVQTFAVAACSTGKMVDYYLRGKSETVRRCDLTVIDRRQNAIVGRKVFEEPLNAKNERQPSATEIPYRRMVDFLNDNLEK